LAEETKIFFDATVADMDVNIDYHPEGKDPLPTIVDYIETWRISVWDIAFFREFATENGVHKNFQWEKQSNSKAAMKRVLFRYPSFSILSFYALLKFITLFFFY
jgi:hypothetical protein